MEDEGDQVVFRSLLLFILVAPWWWLAGGEVLLAAAVRSSPQAGEKWAVSRIQRSVSRKRFSALISKAVRLLFLKEKFCLLSELLWCSAELFLKF